MPKVQFSVAYQFKSQRIGEAILANIASNFILPVWLEKYQQKQDIQFGWTQIIDHRTIKNKEGQFYFLNHDQVEFSNIEWSEKTKLAKKIEEKIQALPQHFEEQRAPRVDASESNQNDYLQKQSQYVNQWRVLLDVLNESFMKSNHQIKFFHQDHIEAILLKHTREKYCLLFRSIQTQEKKETDSKHHEQDYFFTIEKNIGTLNKVSVTIEGKTYQLDKNGDLNMIQVHDVVNESHSQVAIISFLAQQLGSNNIITQQIPSKQPLFLGCEVVDYSQAQNQFSYPFKEYQLRANKVFGYQNYCLAFQGGGAKGLAYVGAYKALQEVKLNNNTVPTKSIMGSSAGGITAIAASTGISYKQIQKICYKMTTIPKKDRIKETTNESAKEDKPIDEYGNQMTFDIIEQKFRAFADQFKVLNTSTIDFALDFLNRPSFKSNLLKLIKIINPSMADIFDGGIEKKTKQKIFSTVEYQQTNLNWAGILLHGALMKGDAIHDIAAECLIKYFLKRSEEDGCRFISKLEDCLLDANSKKINATKINDFVEEYKKINKQLLEIPFGSLIEAQGNLSPFIAFTINNTIVHFNEILQEKSNQSLDLNSIKTFNLSKQFAYQCKKIIDKISQIITLKKGKQQRLIELEEKNRITSAKLRKWLQQNNLEELKNNHEQIEQLERNKFQEQELKEEIEFVKILPKVISILSASQNTLLSYFKKKIIYQSVEEFPKDHLETFDRNLLKLKQKLQFLLQCKTYNEINACSGHPNFIDYTHLDIRPAEIEQLSIKQLIEWHFQAQSIKDNDSGLSEAIFTYFSAEEVDKLNKDNLFRCKKDQFESFIKYVSQLTMKEYYIMNPIELTCTSVDLDNKILRLFNHKTTPDLPICKAIQMTGSFPVGFKAQRWKRQWGYYHLHHQDKLTIIDITGHEFTDGGLLANFPIKYFDNKTIRQCYFSHGQESASILLGFGLHQLEDGSYQKQSNEIRDQYKKNIESNIAKNNIKEMISKCEIIRKVLLSDIFSSTKSAEWGELNLFILQQIPLFRFVFKLLSAYPNADRNLNIQAFSNTIMVQDMVDINEVPAMEAYLRTISNEETQSIKKAKEREWKIRKFYWHFDHFKNAVLIKNIPKKPQLKVKWQKLTKLCKQQQKTQTLAAQSLKKGYELYFKKRFQNALGPVVKQGQDNKISQKQMSLVLIKILLITLKTYKNSSSEAATNNKINTILSERYAFFKFLSKDQSFVKEQLTDKLSNIANIKQKINQENFTNLYESYNFQEIERHFNFTDFQDKFIQSLANQKIQSVSQLQAKDSKTKTRIKEEMLERLNDFKGYFFTDFNHFDISDSIRRLTQYLYFEIKGRSIMKPKTQKTYKYIAEMVKFAKRKEYEDLLQEEVGQQSEKFGFLTYNEIFSFFLELKYEGVRSGSTVHYIRFHQQLEKYLKPFHDNQKELINDREDKINRKYKIGQNLKFGFKFYTNSLTSSSIKYDLTRQQVQQYERSLLSTTQIDQFITEFMFNQQGINYYKDFLGKLMRKKKSQTECETFLTFLKHPLITNTKEVELSIENQIQIKQLKSHILTCLKKQLFGEKLEKMRLISFSQNNTYQINYQHSFVKRFIEDLKKDRENQLMEPLKITIQKDIFKSPSHFSFVQKELLNFFLVKTIDAQIKTKLQIKGRQKSKFYLFHNIYGRDMDYIFKFLREVIILISSLNGQNWSIVQRLYTLYDSIVDIFTLNYEKLFLLPENQLNIEALSQAFLIKFEHILQLVNIAKEINKNLLDDQNQTIPIIKKAFNEFNGYKFSIPMFAQDWMLLFNFTTQFSSLKKEHLPLISPKIRNKIAKSVVGKKRNKAIITRLLGEKKKNLHLVVEGVANSSEHFTAYYQYLQHYKLEGKAISNNDSNFDIKMITSTNIFGFLLALYGDSDVNKIRADLYKIRNYLYQMYDNEQINEIQHGLSISPNNYEDLMKVLSKELSNSFTKFSRVYQSQGERVSYSKYFNDIRLMCQAEQAHYVQTCREIFDKSATQIKQVQDNYLQSQRANEIAKRFAFNYQCQFNENHEYSKFNQNAKTLYLKIVNELFAQFGDLICATTCNLFAANSPLIIGIDKVEQFTKGAMISKLLSAYRLKAFIFERLESYDLPHNVTLKEFYERCPQKIILNFSVINLTEQRLDFMNLMTKPKMPVWAAIIASTTLPIVHRNFWVEREWEELIKTNDNTSFKDKAILEFFKNRNSFTRKQTQYNSAVYISSIPMELLTNRTLNNRLSNLAPKSIPNSSFQTQNIVGLAFNPKYSTNLMHLNLKTNYLKLSVRICQIAARFFFSCTSASGTTTPKSWPFKDNHQKHHLNKTYQVSYNPISSLFNLFTQSAAKNVLTTLSESNDNLILDWYHNYLIRLPIKIGTLEFNSILDDKYMQKYKMQVPSHKTKDTLLRSYEITKTFVYEIEKTGQKSVEDYNDQRKNAGPKRFLAKLRTQIIEIPNKSTGFTKDYLKVTFLNHSKWNHNEYSNYVVQYAIVNTINEKRQPEFTRSDNSEIVWQVEQSSILIVRFYYLHKQKLPNKQFNKKIKFTQMKLDFSDAVKQLHQRNSYDYEFNYGWNEGFENKRDEKIEIKLYPTKVNEIALDNETITSRFPTLKAFIRQKKSPEWSIVNNKKAQQDYIERSDFRFTE